MLLRQGSAASRARARLALRHASIAAAPTAATALHVPGSRTARRVQLPAHPCHADPHALGCSDAEHTWRVWREVLTTPTVAAPAPTPPLPAPQPPSFASPARLSPARRTIRSASRRRLGVNVAMERVAQQEARWTARDVAFVCAARQAWQQHGLPMRFRAAVWARLLGDAAELTHDHFVRLCRVVQAAGFLHSNNDSDADSGDDAGTEADAAGQVEAEAGSGNVPTATGDDVGDATAGAADDADGFVEVQLPGTSPERTSVPRGRRRAQGLAISNSTSAETQTAFRMILRDLPRTLATEQLFQPTQPLCSTVRRSWFTRATVAVALTPGMCSALCGRRVGVCAGRSTACCASMPCLTGSWGMCKACPTTPPCWRWWPPAVALKRCRTTRLPSGMLWAAKLCVACLQACLRHARTARYASCCRLIWGCGTPIAVCSTACYSWTSQTYSKPCVAAT